MFCGVGLLTLGPLFESCPGMCMYLSNLIFDDETLETAFIIITDADVYGYIFFEPCQPVDHFHQSHTPKMFSEMG